MCLSDVRNEWWGEVARLNRSQVNNPWYRGPKLGAPQGSIAQGDTLDNTLTFGQLQ